MFYAKDDKQISVYFKDGQGATWKSDHPQFQRVVDMAQKEDWIMIQFLHNPAKAILDNPATISNTGDEIVITSNTGDEVKAEPTGDPLLEMIALLQKKGILDNNIEPVKPFLRNMLENPFIQATQEIYEYCRNMDFEITPDGCFLAYKRVRADLGSLHDGGKTKHVIGEYTEVEHFDTNRRNYCSNGLHFCAKSYLIGYGGDVTIIVKVNPKDVVSIPEDYNFTKGRCRRYLTVGILAQNGTLQTTNLKEATGEIVVKTETKAKADKKLAKKEAKTSNRILETVQNMKIYKDDVEKVAKVMNISVETVKRNIRKHKAAERA